MKPQDVADLKQLIEFLKEYQVAEFDLDRGDLKIRLKFNQPQAAPAGLSELARLIASAPQGAGQGSAGAAAALRRPLQAPAADPDAGLHMVKSPIVGTYYGSPSPGAAPFVAPGRSRREGPGDLHRRSDEADE